MTDMSDNQDGAPMEGWKRVLDDQLSGWKLRARELASQIAELRGEHVKLEEQIRAAEILLGRSHILETSDDDNRMSVRKKIHLLMRDEKSRSAADIRAALIAAGVEPAKISTNTGALYSALSRLVHQGQLVRSEQGLYHLKGTNT